MSGDASPVLLLVDDEPRILTALTRVLRRERYEILTAGNARDAWATLKAQEVDLVISDYKMPGTSGLELLSRVAKTQPRTARILLSGWSNEIDAAEIETARLHAVLSKPWDEKELKNAVRAAIAQASD
jgi:adenylate cyclase